MSGCRQSHRRKETKQAPEAQTKALAEACVIIVNNQLARGTSTADSLSEAEMSPDIVSPSTRNVFTTTQWLSVVSIIVEMFEMYYKCEELKRVFTKRLPQFSPPSPVDAAQQARLTKRFWKQCAVSFLHLSVAQKKRCFMTKSLPVWCRFLYHV